VAGFVIFSILKQLVELWAKGLTVIKHLIDQLLELNTITTGLMHQSLLLNDLKT
jgi:hypothetical protein